MTNISRRSTDHSAERVSLLVLGHIEANHRFGVVEEEFREGFGEEGLTSTRRTAEQEAGRRVGVAQAGALESDRVGDGRNSLFLSDDNFAQLLLHIEQLVLLGGLEASNGNTGPAGNNLVDLFRTNGICKQSLASFTRISTTFSISLRAVGFETLDKCLGLGDGIIFEISGRLSVARALRLVTLHLERVELDLGILHFLAALLYSFETQ